MRLIAEAYKAKKKFGGDKYVLVSDDEEGNGYEPGECVIHEYHGDDIEGVTILDGNGDVIYIEEEE